MKTPAFWSSRLAPLALLLWPFGFIYGSITTWRMQRRGVKAALPVICVGNLTAGGTGKTPTVQMLARELRRSGEMPFVISRGYGGTLAGPIRVDPLTMSAVQCGDEPLLLARETPVIVSRDRAAGAELARELGASLILLDDGLQNPGLSKDFTIAVVDAEAGFGNGYCIPAGPLRAPIPSQLPRVDAFLSVGGTATETFALELQNWGKPVFRAALQPDPDVLADLAGKPLLAFAGIGRPKRFFATLIDAGLDVRESMAFGDHHSFTSADLASLQKQAEADGLQLVTTEKDFVRLPAEHRAKTTALPVSLHVRNTGLIGMISASIDRRRSAP